MAMLIRIQVLLLLLCTVTATDDSEAETEAEALLRWKSTLINANSLSSWSIANSTCSWFGLTCDTAGQVTELNLLSAGLNGTLDALYSPAFQNLTTINLCNNSLVGTIPANISMLRTLTVLDLSINNLVGDIPANISMLIALTILDLSDNNLTGAIPYQLSKLPRLVHLDLGDNHLTNPEYAMFFTPMPRLEFLCLSNNHLNGTFPEFILNSTSLRMEYLDLSANALSGPIPDSLPEIAPYLRYLFLSSNGFHGSIPNSLSRLQKLQALDVYENNLIGEIPEELGNLTNLKALVLSRNRLVGSLPPSFARMQQLLFLGIESNYINASDTPHHDSNLRGLDISNNNLLGNFPMVLRNLSELKVLNLGYNRISGEIPSWWESEKDVQDIFSSVAQHIVGDGCRTDFWRGNWLPRGGSITNNWPILFSFVGRTKITVAQGLTNNRWVRDLQGSLSNRALADYLALWDELQLVSVQSGQADSVLWRFSTNGVFSVSSAYKFFFSPSIRCPHGELIWKTKEPAREDNVNLNVQDDAVAPSSNIPSLAINGVDTSGGAGVGPEQGLCA
uniref:non-specific serine/threonine protein kinase n=1 Tax=Oryza meridionalis TaxID=40149 RepID=A0A0E0CG06_9ORYZ